MSTDAYITDNDFPSPDFPPRLFIMPTAKHVRFASTNVLYSLTSPPSTMVNGESYTQRRRGSSFSGVATTPSAASSSKLSSQNTPPQPQATLIPEIGLPPRARSRTSSRTSSSQGTPHLHPQSLPPPNPHAPLQLHFLLAYSPFVNSSIKYDLSLHPSILAEYYPSSSLLEPATNPGVSSLTIKSPDLPWPIFVTPNPLLSSVASYVTVVDILNCLYHDLRAAVTKSEYEAVRPALRKEVDAAFWSRCRRVSDLEEEKRKGVKRVDFLMGRNRFLGLSGTRKGKGVWELNVSTWAGN